MILGNKFLRDFEDLCRDLNELAEVIQSNPIGGPGDISAPVIALTPAAVKVSTSAANMLSKIKLYKSTVTTSK